MWKCWVQQMCLASAPRASKKKTRGRTHRKAPSPSRPCPSTLDVVKRGVADDLYGSQSLADVQWPVQTPSFVFDCT
eukprot:6489116-Amphidinium_carterae.1